MKLLYPSYNTNKYKIHMLGSFVLLFLAQLNSLLRRPENAALLAEKSLTLDVQPRPARCRRVARFLRRNKQHARAKSYFRQAIELEPANPRDIWCQAKCCQALGRNEDAIAFFQQYAEKGRRKYAALSKVARLYQGMSTPGAGGRWRMVAESWETVLAANPKKTADWSRLGEAYLVLEEPENARRALERAESRLPGDRRRAFARWVVPYLYKAKRKFKGSGAIAGTLGLLADTLSVFCRGRRAITIWYALGQCHEQLGNPERSSHFYNRAIQNSFAEKIQYGGIGALHAREKRWHEALSAFEKLHQGRPELYDIPVEMGHIYRRLGLFDDAVNYYQKALNAGADEASCLFYSGVALECNELFAEAAEQYGAATGLDDSRDWPRLYYRLGLVLARVGRYAESCHAFINIDANQTTQQFLHNKLEKAPRSEQQSGSLDDLTPTHIWWRAGLEYQKENDWPNAARCFQAAIDREPDHQPEGQYLLGYAQFRQGACQEAADAFHGICIDREVFTHPEDSVFEQSIPSLPVSYVHYRNYLPIRQQTVVYESYDAATIRGNPRAIFEQRSLYDPHDNWQHVWIINNPQNIPAGWKGLPDVVFIPRDCQRYVLFNATAQYIINNSGFRNYIIRREGQRLLNTWHGTPLKTLGKDNKTRFNSRGGVQRVLLQATHLISPNVHTTSVLLDRWELRHIYTGQLAETGYPRIDNTINCESNLQHRIRDRLGLNQCSPVVLFAPTWRGTLEEMDLDTAHLDDDLLAMREVGAQLVFRGHYFLEQRIESLDIDCTVVPGDIDTNALLSIVDILVTDYSSVCVDYLPRQKPVIYYVYDQEKYAAERGLYIFPEQMPGTVCSNRESMVNALKQAMESLADGVGDVDRERYDLSRFNAHDDGDATRRVVDFFFQDDTSHVIHSEADTRNYFNTLIYAGVFKTNGITTALRSLVHNLDRWRINPVVAFLPGSIDAIQERETEFYRFDETMDFFPRSGRQVLTPREQQCLVDAQHQHFMRLSDNQEHVIANASAREFRRMTGAARFDALIDYTGYSQFWSRLFAHAGGDFRRIIYLHNDMQGEQQDRYRNLLSTFALYRHYDVLVSVSESSREINRDNLAIKHGIHPGRFGYADNVFDPDEAQQRAREALTEADAALFQNAGPVFMTIGRLSVEKDHAKLIRAFAEVVQRHAQARLLIVGIGPLHAALEQLVDSLGLVGRVRLLGLRSNPLPLLARADCFVLSSNHEGKPVTIYEALALKKPIISTDLEGTRDALAAGGGHLVANTQKALSEVMNTFAAGDLVLTPPPDLNAYREQALEMFYREVLDPPDETQNVAPIERRAGVCDSRANANLLIAHRGGSGLYLENTLAAFDHAVAAGCDGAELDVHLTADGVLVVHHNGELNHQYTKTPDGRWLTRGEQRPITELTLGELQSYRIGRPNPETNYGNKFPDLTPVDDQVIPTLSQVVELVKRRSETFKLVIEIKSSWLFEPEARDWQPLVDAVLATVKRLNFADRTILCGFDWRSLRYAKRQRPDIPIWMTTHPFDWRDGEQAARSDLPVGKRMQKNLRAADAAGAHWYDGFRPASAEDAPRAVRAAGGDLWFGYYTDCSEAVIANVRTQDIGAGAWTVNLRDRNKHEALTLHGLDVICVDYFEPPKVHA